MIYHITSQSEWNQALLNGSYLPKNFESEGFIHCSKKEQVPGVISRYYANASELFLLKIDPLKLTHPVVFENLSGGEELFPHIYGPLNVSAVTATSRMTRNKDGFFDNPDFYTNR